MVFPLQTTLELGALATLNYPLATLTSTLMTLGVFAFIWPKNEKPNDGACYDYIIIGGGNSLVVANRLTEDEDVHVLVIEAGKAPAIESLVAAGFPIVQNSAIDWKFKSEKEEASQSQSDGIFKIAAGKTLGGSSMINHFIFVRGDPHDFNSWSDIANDPSWNYENILPYFKKMEKVEDEDILNSEFTEFHGTEGPLEPTRELHGRSEEYIDAFYEAGQEKRLDLNGNITYGYAQPFLSNNKKLRQSTAEAYLRPIAHRENLHVMYETVAIKINFDDNNNAVSVDVSVGGDIKTIKAGKEIIVSAGVFNTPKLLMLSGIGPKDHLESMGINVIKDLPVGKNLQEHVAVQIVHKMTNTLSNIEIPLPTLLNFPAIVGSGRVNKLLEYPEYQTSNLIVDTATYLIVCAQIFGYKKETCEEIKNSALGSDVFFTLLANIIPKSTGSVELRSKDPEDPPVIRQNFYSNREDLDAIVEYIKDFLKVQNSTFFKKSGAEVVIPTIDCEGDFSSDDFIRCYALHATTKSYHDTSTCAMGSVVDNELLVNGVNRLRVVDASVMPNIPKAYPYAAGIMIAEKISDVIKAARSKEESLCVFKKEDENKVFDLFGIFG